MTTLVIVESPNKIATIKKYLGNQYDVKASVGHIRDLPDNNMGLDENLRPMYVDTKPDVIAKLKQAARNSQQVVVMTDDDREGEAIGWHIVECLGLGDNYIRCSTNNLNEAGIMKALRSPRKLNRDHVYAQETRRVLDRLIGFKVSKITQTLLSLPSAGRVQSTALRLLVERQELIDKFSRALYLDLTLKHGGGGSALWTSRLDKKSLIESKKFEDVLTPVINDEKGRASPRHITNQMLMHTIQKEVFHRRQVTVESFTQHETRTKAPAPFVTSTLLQTASSTLKLSAGQTMDAAQRLFEKGYITYHRTDSTSFDESSIKMIRDFISKWQASKKTDQYLSPIVNTFKSKDGAQEGHEAIRPSNLHADINGIQDEVERNLYQLIYCRTIASQMADARFNKTEVTLKSGFAIRDVEIKFIATGRMPVFDGWKVIYKEIAERGEHEEDSGEEQLIPELRSGQLVDVRSSDVEKKHTRPPSRYTEATLIKELERKGIGRPSTYASIIKTLYKRVYMKSDSGYLVPTSNGKALVNGLKPYFQFLQYEYTAQMEAQIDRVAHGQSSYDIVIPKANQDIEFELSSFISQTKASIKLRNCPNCKEESLIQKESKEKNFQYYSCITDGCDTFFPDKDGEPNYDYKPPVITNFDCPKCTKAKLILSNKKPGKTERYFYCKNNKKCNFVTIGKVENGDWTPDLAEFKRDHNHTCPECNRAYLAQRHKKQDTNSKFWVCQGCSTFLEDKDNEPDLDAYRNKKAEFDNLVSCPECNTGKLLKCKDKALFRCSNISGKQGKKCKTFVDMGADNQPDIQGYLEKKNNTESGNKPKALDPTRCPICKTPLQFNIGLRQYHCLKGHEFHAKSDGQPDFEEITSLQKKTYI